MNAPTSITPALTNADLMERRKAALPRGVGQGHPIFAARAENAEIWDVEGRRWIDFCAGIAVVNTGHRHPKIVEAVRKQLESYTHTCFQVVAYEGYVALCERLNKLMPGATPKKSFLMNSGAEAVENAIKVARAYTGRRGVIAFGGGFHGRTMFTMALTGKVDPYKIKFGPFAGDIYHVPYPDPIHGVTEEESFMAINRLFKWDIEATEVAAIIVEAVQGEGGYIPASTNFIKGLRELCDKHGIMLIVDEVQTGVARCGKMFAIEHHGIEPDVMTMAKGLGGGLVISAVIGKAHVMDAAVPGGLGSTYAGNPLAVASALAVLDVVEEEKLADRAAMLGQRMRLRLGKLKERFDCVADVRGLGAMTAVEFCHQGDPQHPAGDIATALKNEAAKRGLLLLNCGSYGNVLRIMIPLTIPESVLDEGLSIIEDSLAAVTGK